MSSTGTVISFLFRQERGRWLMLSCSTRVTPPPLWIADQVRNDGPGVMCLCSPSPLIPFPSWRPLQNLPSFPRRRESMGKSNLVDWESGHIIVVLLSFAKVSMMGKESKSLSQYLTRDQRVNTTTHTQIM